MPNDLMGINIRDLMIGIQGGISGVFVLRRSKPRDILGTVTAGGLTANYFGSMVENVLGTPHDLSVYMAGLAGLTICHVIIDRAAEFTKRITK
jgi:hypothetical protein